ncbi:hypothetical protein LCGC14_2350350 [marine sediment metagenome]|uniref:Uncharacterized protein n=1 Tax=marine sediment metagenome TaxID=412755 RepID=A0A0F9C9A0_9ZZZZ
MKFKNIPIWVGPTDAIVKQIDNMSDEEYKVQLALGLLCDWIVVVEDRAILLQRGPSVSAHELDRSHLVYIVVKALNREHAKHQVRQSRYFLEEDFRICSSWQNDAAGAYYREKFYSRHASALKEYNRERIFVLS